MFAALAASLAVSPTAAAGPPTHFPLPDFNLTGFDHACAVATDSAGDLYVSSVGETPPRIEIFRPSDDPENPWEPLGSLTEGLTEPCGLAVDTEGNLYVSDSGEVFNYHPGAYPFAGAPSYEPPEMIDSSGSAKGIAVDPLDDRLYVARNGGVSVYQSDGAPEVDLEEADETQKVELSAATAGTFTLAFQGQGTSPIPYNATPSEVGNALEALPTIGAGGVDVEGAVGEYSVTFIGGLGGTDVDELVPSSAGLEGVEGPTIVVAEEVKGFDLLDPSGVAIYTSPSDENRHLSVAENEEDLVRIFGGEGPATLSLRRTVDGSDEDALKVDKTPSGDLGFGPAGTSLAADQTNGHIFLYDHANQVLDEFELSGAFITQIPSPDPPFAFDDAEPTGIAAVAERDEVQHLRTRCTGGTFTLSFESDGQTETTAPIPCDTPAAEPGGVVDSLQEHLEELSTVGAGNITVSGSKSAVTGEYSIAFVASLGGRNVSQLEVDGAELVSNFNPPTEITTEAQGAGPGRVYVTAGAGAGSALLTFGPLAPPRRRDLREGDSLTLDKAASVAVDEHGNRYVATTTKIGVYPPGSTTRMLTIEDTGEPVDLAVDSECNIYVLDRNAGLGIHEETVRYFSPSPKQCPPGPDTAYTPHGVVLHASDFTVNTGLHSLAVDPATDGLYVTQTNGVGTMKLDSAKNGSNILDREWGSGLPKGRQDIDVCAAMNTVYFVAENGTVAYMANSAGTKILHKITGKGSLRGEFPPHSRIAVNQANCHVIVFSATRGVAEEYEPSGGFVAQFGSFTTDGFVPFNRIAVDNSCALREPELEGAACETFDPSNGKAYVAFDDPDNEAHPFDLTAFDPLSYGEPPNALTGRATGVGGGSATLNGTVDPNEFPVEGCRFEYLSEAEYRSNLETAEGEGHGDPEVEGYGFQGAKVAPCAEMPEEIGSTDGAVAVHAQIGGLLADGRYRFRLVAENEFGPSPSESGAGLFGPPVLATKGALPVSYLEATLRATLDPAGLPTEYQFEYGETEAYGRATPKVALPATAGTTEIEIPVFGLVEGETYHFRIVAENEAMAASGSDEMLTTFSRRGIQTCPNDEFRIGLSANLPDCRAYELVSPADTRGKTPLAMYAITHQFDNWLVAPSGAREGRALSFFTEGTLPGFDGNGAVDGYRAERGDGPHPAGGWRSELFSPTYRDSATNFDQPVVQEGVSSDQQYSIWRIPALEGTLDPGTHLRTPAGFERLGQGSLGQDPDAFSHYVSPAGAHVIFSSKAHLESATPSTAANTSAIYDREAGSSIAKVVSLKPGEEQLDPGESATYLGATEDGTAIAFKAGGALYLRRGGETVKAAGAPNTFAGISADGEHVFFVDAAVGGPTPVAAGLWMYDTNKLAATEIAANSRFVNIASDGSHVYFTSTDVADDAFDGVAGEDNLYVWDGATGAIRFVAVLDPQDVAQSGFGGTTNLVRWTDAVGGAGRAISPTRSAAGGSALVFQSHARLTAYDSTEATAAACGDPEVADEPCAEIYRYDDTAAPDERLICVSCNPSGARPVGIGVLQEMTAGMQRNLVANVSEDGRRVFFQSEDALLPEDANQVVDIYEWQAQGTGGCLRLKGCLALISSGQGERDSSLYSMTPDGNDVFFTTQEKLVGGDIPGSPSIYDARVEGGIPDQVAIPPCHGDACQGQGSTRPVLPASASSTVSGDDGVHSPNSFGRCGKEARAARHYGLRAKRLRRRARRARSGSAKAAIRRRAARQAKRSRRLAKRVQRCRARQRKRASADRRGSR